MSRWKGVIFFALLITILESYPTCIKMQINGYLYDLSRMPSNYLFTVQNTISSFVDFSFCQPITCDNRTSFVHLKEGGRCIPHSSQLNPMRQNYTMIDSSAPKRGVRVNFLPYFNNETQALQTAVLNIYCPSVSTVSNICQSNGAKIECSFSSEAGCAEIKLNYFWQFLSDNKIVFAILLWIVAFFQLLFGYLAIRMTIFIFGILSGALFGIIYMAENYVNFIYESEGYGIAVFIVCLSVLMGILFGVSLLTLPRLGYVNIGLWVAFIFSLLLQNSVLYLTGDLLAFYITVGVVGFIMAAIALMKLKNFIILSTSFISAFWLVRPLGFFLPYYPNEFLSGNSYLLNGSTNWQFYLYLISIIILTILGAVFQFCCFKRAASGNQAYYLEQEGTLKEKFKKLLEFEEIRHFIRSGAQQLRFFKQLIVQDSQEQEVTPKNNKVKTVSQSEQDQRSMSRQSWSEEEKPSRKKTKVQKQMQDYQAKKAKKQDQNKLFTKRSKQKQSLQPPKRNRKVAEIPIEQNLSQEESKKSQDQQSEDVKPERLIANNRGQNR